MADVSPEIKQPSSTNHQNKKNPSKFYSHFLFKSLIFTIFLAIIPLFPSESPVYTRGWELFYLIFVGIAVSYGLFSQRRNVDDLEGENNSKLENSHSYMSRLLQFPSVFDDEVENPSGSDGNKYQTWSSRYHRNEPMVVLAKRGSVSVENSRASDEKPLLLPVRSLISRVSDENGVDSRVFARTNSMPTFAQKSYSSDSEEEDYEACRVSRGLNSSLSSKGSSNDSGRNSVSSEFVYVDEDYETSRVTNRSNSSLNSNVSANDLRRIIRQESVNSRMTVPSEFGYANGDYETSRVTSRSNSSVSSKGSSNDSRRMSKTESLKLQTSVPTEFGNLKEGNGVSGSLRSLSSSSSRGLSNSSSRDLNAKYVDFDKEHKEDQDGKVAQSVILSSPIPWQSRSKRVESKGENLNDLITFSRIPSMVEIEPSPSINCQSSLSNTSFSMTESQAKNVEDLGGRNITYSSRLPPPAPPPSPPPPRSMGLSTINITKAHTKANEIVQVQENERNGGGSKSMRKAEQEKTRKSGEYSPISKEPFSEFPKETRDFLEGLLLENDDDSESEDIEDNYLKSKHSDKTEKLEEEVPPNNITDEGPDVDKKADEFIAKFREQIRLQRIASIKRSTGELKRSSMS